MQTVCYVKTMQNSIMDYVSALRIISETHGYAQSVTHFVRNVQAQLLTAFSAIQMLILLMMHHVPVRVITLVHQIPIRDVRVVQLPVKSAMELKLQTVLTVILMLHCIVMGIADVILPIMEHQRTAKFVMIHVSNALLATISDARAVTTMRR